ncbi:hypothetical protein KFL01_10210 [Kocuria flava]|uniref:Uncharacterized protein n=1 Tax=Kocuria flava TaxID=446860 RepID=A0ABQ0X2Y1_9MICC|nr:hypothetical protein KFL01_10210 [Kocuria flava]
MRGGGAGRGGEAGCGGGAGVGQRHGVLLRVGVSDPTLGAAGFARAPHPLLPRSGPLTDAVPGRERTANPPEPPGNGGAIPGSYGRGEHPARPSRRSP